MMKFHMRTTTNIQLLIFSTSLTTIMFIKETETVYAVYMIAICSFAMVLLLH